MKVLQVSKLYYPWIGGVERVVQDIAQGISDEVESNVLVCQPRGKGVVQRINGVDVVKASSLGMVLGSPVSLTFPFLLNKYCSNVDIVHFHLPFPLGVMSYLLTCWTQKKVAVTYHSDIVRQKKLLRLYKPFLKRFLRKSDIILPTSPNLIEHSPYLRKFKDKCKVVPLSVDLQRFNLEEPERGIDIGIDEGRPLILFVGRLSYYKGLKYLIEAMNQVEANLLIAGEGELRKHLENKVEKLRMTEKVRFLGKVDDELLEHLYKICDLFVLPSIETSEAFGIVQLEAMASGLPVVNTNLPTGVPYVSKDGETGITVKPRDSTALAEAIKKLMNNEKLKEKFSRNARKRVEEKFSRKKMIERVKNIYNELMEKPRQ